MRSLLRRCAMVAAILCCCGSLGCDGLTLGPRLKTTYVLVHPGRPIQVLENRKVKGRVLDGSGDVVTEDIGGWVCMPESHFRALQRAAEISSTPAPAPAR